MTKGSGESVSALPVAFRIRTEQIIHPEATMFNPETILSWLFTSTGFTMLAFSVVLVPADAFGSSGSECSDYCSLRCLGPNNSIDMDCYRACALEQCKGDPACGTECCTAACSGDPVCESQCTAAFITCSPGNITCTTNLTSATCEPGFEIYCPSMQKDCSCRWRPIVSTGKSECVCNNITGN